MINNLRSSVSALAISAAGKGCTRCHKTKPHSEYHYNFHGREQKQYWCKSCITEYGVAYRAKKKTGLPQTDADFREAVEVAYFCWTLDSLRQYGLIDITFEIDVERCMTLLDMGKERGILPTALMAKQ